ncbi:MAG: peptidylprolyl isomerase [Candidatus Thiodiazotropha sp.]
MFETSNKIFREPLIVFSLIGGLLFLLYAQMTPDDTQKIYVSQATIDDLIAEREMVLNRDLSQAEEDALISGFIDREILVREAVSRGLYLKDPNIHKRLSEKMAFILDEDVPEPTADELQAQFDNNRKHYLTPKAVTFEHIFFSSGRDPADAENAMAVVHSDLSEAEKMGDVFWLGRRMEHYSSKQLLMLLGFDFNRQLSKLPSGEWKGPIKSASGWHLVRVIQRHEPKVLPDEELQNRLIADWKAAWQKRRQQQQIAVMREQYEIVLQSQGS